MISFAILLYFLADNFWTDQVIALKLFNSQLPPAQKLTQKLHTVPEFAPLHTLKAIQNVNSNKGSVWLFHTTHHAGTSLSQLFSKRFFFQPSNNHGCFIDETDLSHPKTFFYLNVCGENGISVPFGEFGKKFSRNSDALLTIYPIRHPIHRNMAGDGMGTWKERGPDACFTDNYGLRKLLGLGFDVRLTRDHIEAAKARAASFDIIMDMTNFTEGLETLCGHLHWSCQSSESWLDKHHQDQVTQFQKEHPDIYKKWIERNAPEIEFYEYTRELAQTRYTSKFEREKHLSMKSPGMPSEPIHLEYEEERAQRWVCGPL